MVAIVYLARNQINGKRYIGVTCRGLAARRWRHENDAARAIDSSPRFHQALRKHGFDAFEWSVIETFPTAELALRGEAEAIASAQPEYNILAGGLGVLGRKWTDEQRARQSAKRKGMVFSAEHRRNLSLAHLGKKPTPETVAKRVAKMTGRPLSAEHRAAISATLTGHPGFKKGTKWEAKNVAL